MSEGIADLLLGQIGDSPAEKVVAPGASCRSQLDDLGDGDMEPPHPIEMVAAALR
jgi:Fe-S oxidoreductase